MSNPEPPVNPIVNTELALEKLREYVAGGLAFLIILGMLAICYIAVQSLAEPVQFQGAKDLLLLITPFVGVVIGYYFNKVTSDSRAAALQRAADSASQLAMSAAVDSQRAEQQAQQAQAQADQMRGALTEMVNAADSAGVGQPGAPGTLSPDGGAPSNAQIELRVALERAKRVLNG